MPSCLIVQHVEPEGPYAVETVLLAAGVDVDVRRVFTDRLPDSLDEVQGLVVMGGPVSAASDVGFPTRQAELGLLAEALELGLPTLGICLGAQLLAVAAGGRVLRGADGPEIGWGPVDLRGAADPLFDGLPARLSVLHWHGDTYERPPGSVLLATSPTYREQAFRFGSHAWGLQFHIEVDAPAVDAFLSAFGQDAYEAGTNPEAIAAATLPAIDALTPHRTLLLERFAGLVADKDVARPQRRLAEPA
jgi:GMP synthase-like glutamine amidotransferase